ncbi:aminoglycoside phosphotransferase family protein [Microbacterium insulae]|uniref:Aminoglycoside phosphotransferase family protein n=1 Tax=Microbacterium insulae TaxID=483014 RepID=A0ABW3ALB6_9MICO
MADKPAGEVVIDEALVRQLLREQAGALEGATSLPLARVSAGWDNEVWRLGEDWAVRLPRRAAAASLIVHEHRALPLVGPAIEATGVRVPMPVVRAEPGSSFPWRWSVAPWIEGSRGIDVPWKVRTGWAESLAAALGALHVAAPPDHPPNPVRGVPLPERADSFTARREALVAARLVTDAEERAVTTAWEDGLAEPPWTGPPVWIHGDLHPGNIVADAARLVGIIDFGDVTAGDPAYDLAVAWLAFDANGRERFRAATGPRYDLATWTRARAWAAAVAVLLLAHSDDEPDYAALGRSALDEIVSGS